MNKQRNHSKFYRRERSEFVIQSTNEAGYAAGAGAPFTQGDEFPPRRRRSRNYPQDANLHNGNPLKRKNQQRPDAIPFINSIGLSNVMRELISNELKLPFQLSTVTNAATWPGKLFSPYKTLNRYKSNFEVSENSKYCRSKYSRDESNFKFQKMRLVPTAEKMLFY